MAVRTDRRGAVALEVAIVLPLLLVLLLGLWEVGRVIEAHQVVCSAAREAGRQVSTGRRTSAAIVEGTLERLELAGLPARAPSSPWRT